jgi:hypothetical protein
MPWLKLRAAAVSYVKESESFQQADFERAAGVGVSSLRKLLQLLRETIGVVVPPEEIKQIVEDYLKTNIDQIRTQGEWSGIGRSLAHLRTKPELRWANPLDVKAATEAAYMATFGPKQDAATAKAKAKVRCQ